MGQMWWSDSLPYRVVSPGGDVLFQTALHLRHPPQVERALMEQRCTIWIDGKRLTRKELTQRGQENKMQSLSRPGAEIGPDGRCCGCRMAFLATRRGMMYGSLMGQLYQAGIDPETLEVPDLPPVRDIRKRWR